MQIQNHGQIKPTFTGPDITDVHHLSVDRRCPCIAERPFLIGLIRLKVTVQQVGCDVELVVVIRCYLVFASLSGMLRILLSQKADFFTQPFVFPQKFPVFFGNDIRIATGPHRAEL